MTFYIYTLGCKVNTYESEVMQEKMLEHGFTYSKENPTIIIVNTCTVTNVADHKSIDMVYRFRKKHENAILVVCGCASENKDKSKIVDLIQEFIKTKKPIVELNQTRELPFEDMKVKQFTTHTRAFLKIQDGCNNFCSYCIIPHVRGVQRCKDFQLALDEIKELSKYHKEIVFTGIHTGSYESNGYDLTDLIHEASKIPDLKRIRISSIEVTEITDKFLKEFKENPKICPHFHIPLQAGSDEILKKMKRKYNLSFFENTIKKIREICPRVSITTDIIVGHPYETQELFQKTVDFSKKIEFSKIHVFPFSKRNGTIAAAMTNQVNDVLKKQRSKELCKLSEELEICYAKKFIGQTVEVLIEKENDVSSGLTDNYLRVQVAKRIPNNTMVPLKIVGIDGKTLIGEEVKETVSN